MYVDHRETPMGTRRICNEVNKWKVKSEKKKSQALCTGES